MTEAATLPPKEQHNPDYLTIPYGQFVAVLVKPGETIRSEMTAEDAHALHMVVGVVGEVAELLEVVLNKPGCGTLPEELGDLEFYTQALRDWLNMELAIGAVEEPEHPLEAWQADEVLQGETMNMAIRAGHLLDAVKRVVIYRKGIDARTESPVTDVIPTLRETMMFSLAEIAKHMAKIRSVAGLSQAEVLLHNRTKLMTRYKSVTYSDSAAQGRADKSV